jgi:glucokinase
MIGSTGTGLRPWLLIEASREGVLRFAMLPPSPRPRIGEIHEVEVAGLPTFTDALQKFEREKNVPLSGLQCAMAIAGAASGETISLVRSRWTISRAGLQAIFGTQPVIINDVAARAWATRSGTANMDLLRGSGTPSFTRPGRYAMLMVEEGVNASIVDIDREAGVRVLETECGHMDFAPTSDKEERVARAVRGTAAIVSWEKMLMIDRFDPAWAKACPEMLEAERPRFLAALLGRFAVNLMHSYGAWQGVMITGTRAGRMLESANRVYFDSSFTTRRTFSRLVIGAPAWRVDQHEAVLTGAAERLAHGLAPEVSAAAA